MEGTIVLFLMLIGAYLTGIAIGRALRKIRESLNARSDTNATDRQAVAAPSRRATAAKARPVESLAARLRNDPALLERLYKHTPPQQPRDPLGNPPRQPGHESQLPSQSVMQAVERARRQSAIVSRETRERNRS